MALQVAVEWSLSVAGVEALVQPLFREGSGQCPLNGNEDKNLQLEDKTVILLRASIILSIILKLFLLDTDS